MLLVDKMVRLYGEDKLNFEPETLTQLFRSAWNATDPWEILHTDALVKSA